MHTYPLSLNLEDFSRVVPIIGEVPTSAFPSEFKDLGDYWESQLNSDPVMQEGAHFIRPDALTLSKWSDPIELDAFLNEIAGPMPDRLKKKTFILLERPEAMSEELLTSIIASSRPNNICILVFVSEFSKISRSLTDAIFGNCPVAIVGKLTNQDKEFFQKNRYFQETTEAILGLGNDEYALYKASFPPSLAVYDDKLNKA